METLTTTLDGLLITKRGIIRIILDKVEKAARRHTQDQRQIARVKAAAIQSYRLHPSARLAISAGERVAEEL